MKSGPYFLYKTIPQLLLHVLLGSIAVIMLYPVVFMIAGSLKSSQEIQLPQNVPDEELAAWRPAFFPRQPTMQNYRKVFRAMPFGRYYWNSIVITVTRTFLVILTSSLVGYVFAKFKFRGRDAIFVVLLSTMIMPFVVVLVPLFLVVSYLGLADTYAGLIMPGIVSIFGIFLMRQNIRDIPNDLIESARMDGATEWWIYARVILPLVKPSLSALGIFTFMWNWNDYVWPLVITISDKMRTLPLGIAQFQTEHIVRYDLTITAATISMIPVLLVFLIAQKQFVKGITMSGMKG